MGLSLLACLLLVIAEFSDLNEIQIGTTTRTGIGVGENHGFALLIVAVVAVPMAYAAWRSRARPAGVAVAALGAVAVFVVLAVDAPETDTTGVIGRNYEDAASGAAGGFRLAAAGSVLLLFAGGLTAVRGAGAPARGPSADRERPSR